MGPWSGETGTVRTSRTLGKGRWRDRLSAVHRSQHCGEWLLSSYGALLDLLWLTAFNKLLMASDSGFRHLFSLFFFIVAMISTCGQDRLAGMISSFPMALGLSGCSWKSMQVQRTVLARGSLESHSDSAARGRERQQHLGSWCFWKVGSGCGWARM